jgi:hypothetical protein
MDYLLHIGLLGPLLMLEERGLEIPNISNDITLVHLIIRTTRRNGVVCFFTHTPKEKCKYFSMRDS